MVVRAARKRVKRSAQDRRREIMDAALAVFRKKGVAGATVSDITAAAGVAKGTFYLYFQTKEHVVAALREQFVTELMDHAMPFIEKVDRGEWWPLVDALARDMVEWTLAHRDVIAALLQSYSPETHDVLAQADLAIIHLMGMALMAGAEAGAFEVTDPELAAAFLYNGTIYTVVQQIMHSPEVDRDRLVRVATDLAHKLLSPFAARTKPTPTKAASTESVPLESAPTKPRARRSARPVVAVHVSPPPA